MTLHAAARRLASSSLPFSRHFFSSSSSASPRKATKPPLLFAPNSPTLTNTVTLELYSWGRGSSGQLGASTSALAIYPTPVATLLLPPSFHLSPIPGSLNRDSESGIGVGISCGLFHSALLVDGKVWIWGKGDGGRLGLGNEETVFVPTLNLFLDGVRSVALGGLHSVALTSVGEVFTWSVSAICRNFETMFTIWRKLHVFEIIIRAIVSGGGEAINNKVEVQLR